MLNIPGLKGLPQTAGNSPVAEVATELTGDETGSFLRALEAIHQAPVLDPNSAEPDAQAQSAPLVVAEAEASADVEVDVPVADANAVLAQAEQLATEESLVLPVQASPPVEALSEAPVDAPAVQPTPPVVDQAPPISAQSVVVDADAESVSTLAQPAGPQPAAPPQTEQQAAPRVEVATDDAVREAPPVARERAPLARQTVEPAAAVGQSGGTAAAEPTGTAQPLAPAAEQRPALVRDDVDPPPASATAVAAGQAQPRPQRQPTAADAAAPVALQPAATGEATGSAIEPALPQQSGTAAVDDGAEAALRASLQLPQSPPAPQTPTALQAPAAPQTPPADVMAPLVEDLPAAVGDDGAEAVAVVVPERAAPRAAALDAEVELVQRAAPPPRPPQVSAPESDNAQPIATAASRAETVEAAVKQSVADNGARAAMAQQSETPDVRRLHPALTAAPDSGGFSLVGERTSLTESLGGLLPNTLNSLSSATASSTEVAGAHRLVNASVRANINWMIEQGMARATLQLNPAELGALSIKLETLGDQLNVNIHAAQSATRDVLEQTLPRLREHLSQQGFSEVNVSLGNNQQQSSEYSQSRGGEGPTPGGLASAPGRDGDDATGAGRAVATPRGLVDVFA